MYFPYYNFEGGIFNCFKSTNVLYTDKGNHNNQQICDSYMRKIVSPHQTMYQMGNPDTHINSNIYLYRETHSHTLTYI